MTKSNSSSIGRSGELQIGMLLVPLSSSKNWQSLQNFTCDIFTPTQNWQNNAMNPSGNGGWVLD
jgi:hypothetical protein